MHLPRLARRARHAALVAATAGLATAGLAVVAGPASAAPPGNDNIATATTLTPNVPLVGTNDDATLQTLEKRQNGNTAYRTVWYKYTPGANQNVSFETFNVGDNPDTVITLYTGAPGAATFADLTFVTSNDDAADLFSEVALAVNAGTTYFLQVDIYDADTPHGNFGLRLNLAGPASGVPANDNLASAARLISGINAVADNRNATTEGTEPQQAGCVTPIRNSVWYTYNSVTARDLEFYTVGASASVVNVYSGPVNATPAQLVAVDCDDDNAGDSSVSLSGAAATRYYVQVGSPAAGGSAVPFTVVAEQSSWNQTSKVTATGAASATQLTLTATALPDPYANSPVPLTFGGAVEFLGPTGASLGTVPLTGTTASLTIPRPAAGAVSYTALFVASNDDYRDAFRQFTVTVPKLVSTTTVKAKKVTLAPGQTKKVKVKATVKSTGATPTGTVTFKVGKKSVKATLKNGVATVKIKVKKTTKVAVTYSGDANTAGSTAKAKIKVKIKK